MVSVFVDVISAARYFRSTREWGEMGVEGVPALITKKF